jgi:vitamin B12 transporter
MNPISHAAWRLLHLETATVKKNFILGRAAGRKSGKATFPGRRFLHSTTAIALVLAPAAMAQETLVVSATRVAAPLNQVASSVTVIGQAEIEARQLRSLPDILSAVPGLNVVRAGGLGGQTSLFTRGTNSNHTKILLDGIDIADTSTPSGATDLGKLLAGDIARVEVLRGPQSGLYGSDAIGGVINIVTQEGEGPLTFTASAEAGSFDTFNQSAAVSGSEGDFHYRATLNHVHAGATPVTPLNLLPAGRARNDDVFDTVTASTRLGLDVTEEVTLGLTARWSQSLAKVTNDAFDPVTFGSSPSASRTRIVRQNWAARGTAQWNPGWIDQTLGFAYSSGQSRSADPDNGAFATSGDRIKLDWQGNIPLADGHLLVLGAETARDAVHIPVSAGYTTNAGFAELNSDFGHGIHASASLRYDDNSQFGGQLTWRIAPSVEIGDTGFRLKGSAGTGFKAPSLDQLYHDYPGFFAFLGNPNLKPETSTGYEIGFDGALFGLTGGATWFRNDIEDLIAANASFTTSINIGKARTEGVEAFIGWQPLEEVRLRADYSFTDAVDETTNLALIRRPNHKASLTGGWQFHSDADLSATLLYVGPWIDGSRDFAIPRLKTEGYVTVNLAARWQATERFTLFARGDNLFDETYENPVGFLGPERAFYVGVQAKL